MQNAADGGQGDCDLFLSLQFEALGEGCIARGRVATDADLYRYQASLDAFADQLRRTSDNPMRTLIAVVTTGIATLRLPYRPDRIEPRAKKHRPKNLPQLTVPSQVARDLIYAQ